MSDTKFTPGPWLPTTTPAGKGKVTDRKGFSVCNVTTSTYKQQIIDSHLIAAAPELYEALEESNRHLVGEFGINHPLVKANRQALAKARGEM